MVKSLRLYSGFVLFAYVATHLLNHALGLISIDAMNAGREAFIFVWRGWIGTVLLPLAFVTHIGLALWALYRRHRLRMHAWEVAQLLLGLAIPVLLAQHVIGTRLAHELYGTQDNYVYVMLVLWVASPTDGILQVVTLLVAWVHGAIGLHYWLRLRRWYRPCQPIALALGTLVPAAALFGFNQAGHEIAILARDGDWLQSTVATLNLPSDAQVARLLEIRDQVWVGFAGLLGLTLAARGIRAGIRRRRGLIRISYPDGQQVDALPGMTVLEASRQAGIPHASVCGGRGRCSTCRVKVGSGVDAVPAPSEDELRVLSRIGAAPNVRLACQLRPTAPVEVFPLLPPDATPREVYNRPAHLAGQEREVAVLFADLRAFTRFSESKLPYDVVFVLNRYFQSMGQAIEETGGHLDKFIGDGVMALFGVDSDSADGARRALDAARRMAEQLDKLNDSLAHDLEEPLKMGIGIHMGPVIVGEMGYAAATHLTAVGDTVNTASRLEALTKDYGVQLIVSETVAARSGADLSVYPQHSVNLRGRSAGLKVYAVENATRLRPS